MRKTVRIIPTKFNGRFIAGVGGMALLLCVSQSWAGTGGPGWASRLNGSTPAPSSSANAADKQDFETAKSCKARPKLMMPTQACQQAMGRHPEFFPASATAH
jgi:hypothetical protein